MGFQVLSCLTHKSWYDENAMSKGLGLGALSMSWELLLRNTKKKCYYGNFKKSSGSLKRQLQNLLSVGKDQMCCYSASTYVWNIFHQAKALLTIGKECIFHWVSVSWAGGQNGLELGEGECWAFARHILKVRKEERREDSHPACCFSCHSKESQAKFGTYSGKKIEL